MKRDEKEREEEERGKWKEGDRGEEENRKEAECSDSSQLVGALRSPQEDEEIQNHGEEEEGEGSVLSVRTSCLPRASCSPPPLPSFLFQWKLDRDLRDEIGNIRKKQKEA